MAATTKTHNILALDVGEKRVGVALANSLARLPRPHVTLLRDERLWDELEKLLEAEEVQEIVVGLPRNLSGNDTAQTKLTRQFIVEFKQRFNVTVHVQDEALTSKKAEAELSARGKKFEKGDVDALAATYILEDYLNMGVS